MDRAEGVRSGTAIGHTGCGRRVTMVTNQNVVSQDVRDGFQSARAAFPAETGVVSSGGAVKRIEISPPVVLLNRSRPLKADTYSRPFFFSPRKKKKKKKGERVEMGRGGSRRYRPPLGGLRAVLVASSSC